MRTGRIVGLWLASLAIYACAKGGAPVGDDVQDPDARVTVDAQPQIDGPITPTVDARVDAAIQPPDAFVPPPDATPPPPDAAVVNPPFCDSNDDCVEPDTCCFVVACVPGLAIGSACFPE
jgi:hypothetical protein